MGCRSRQRRAVPFHAGSGELTEFRLGTKGEYDGWDAAEAWARTVDVARQAERLGFVTRVLADPHAAAMETAWPRLRGRVEYREESLEAVERAVEVTDTAQALAHVTASGFDVRREAVIHAEGAADVRGSAAAASLERISPEHLRVRDYRALAAAGHELALGEVAPDPVPAVDRRGEVDQLGVDPAEELDLVVVGTLEGTVQAFSANDGADRWTAQLSSEVISPPAIGANIVAARTQDGRVFGLDVRDGKPFAAHQHRLLGRRLKPKRENPTLPPLQAEEAGGLLAANLGQLLGQTLPVVQRREIHPRAVILLGCPVSD